MELHSIFRKNHRNIKTQNTLHLIKQHKNQYFTIQWLPLCQNIKYKRMTYNQCTWKCYQTAILLSFCWILFCKKYACHFSWDKVGNNGTTGNISLLPVRLSFTKKCDWQEKKCVCVVPQWETTLRPMKKQDIMSQGYCTDEV